MLASRCSGHDADVRVNCTLSFALHACARTPRPVALAVPPMWNVRIVSCVPGSPID